MRPRSDGDRGRARRALLAYDAALAVGGMLLLPAAGVALALRPDWRAGLGERLGHVPPTRPGRRALWLHGASVGEIAALAPIVRALRHEHPDDRIVVSSVTPGGRAAAATRVPEADDRILLPLDLPWTAARAVDAIAPALVLFTETELWPNFLATLAARRVPAIMVSGRLSSTAFHRYRRARALFAGALATVRWFCVQSLASARRLVALGAPPARVVVTGSLKAAVPDVPPGGLTLATLGAGGDPVLVAASTHAPEEWAMLAAWRRARTMAPDLRLVLAPRRPERFDEVATALSSAGVAFVRRSTLAGGAWPAASPVLLLDSLGELAGLYGGARAAFVGGTLAPVGGHNLLEPAAHGTPVVFGPHVENVTDAAGRLVATGGGVRVGDAEALAACVTTLVADPVRARAAGEAARAAVQAGEGPLAVTMSVVRGTLAAAGGER